MQSLAQLSDPHIVEPGERLGGHVDTAAALRQAVRAVMRLAPRPDAVLISGDLVNRGSAREYRHLRELLEPLCMPLYLMPGNHDERQALRAAFPEHAYLGQRGPVDYAVPLGGLQLIALDSVVAGAAHGALAPAQLQGLERALLATPQVPTVVALHHPPFATGIGFMDALALREGAGELAEVLARHPQVERLVCGHVHRCIQRRWGGTMAMTAPSTAHQIHLDLSSSAAEAYTLEPPAFLLHVWGGGGALVSHYVPTAPFEGPFPYA